MSKIYRQYIFPFFLALSLFALIPSSAYSVSSDDTAIKKELIKINEPKHREQVWKTVKEMGERLKWEDKPTDYATVISSLASIPQEKYSFICKAFDSITLDKPCDPYSIHYIINCLSDIPKERFDKTFPNVQKLADGKDWDVESISSLLATLTQLPEHQSAFLIRVLQPLSAKYGFTPKVNLLRIISILCTIPENKFDSTLKVAELFGGGKDWNAYEMSNILLAFSSTQPEQHKFIENGAQVLTKDKECDPQQFVSVIFALSQVPEDRFNDVVDLAKKIGPDVEWSPGAFAKHLPPLVHIPSGQVDDVLNLVNAVISIYPEEVLRLKSAEDLLWVLTSYPCKDAVEVHKLWTKYSKKDPRDISEVLCCLSFLPPSYTKDLLEDPTIIANFDFDSEDLEWEEMLLKVVQQAADVEKQEIFAYWKNIINGAIKHHTVEICDIVLDNVDELGLYEQHDLVKTATHVQTLLEVNDETSPYTIFAKLKKSLTVPIEWDKLPEVKGTICGHNGRLDLEEISKFGSRLKVDFDSTPLLNSTHFINLMDGLVAARKQNQELMYDTDVLCPELPKLIRKANKPTSQFVCLMNGNPKHLPASQLKCVVNWFNNMGDSPQKWLRVATFLAGVRKCQMGKNTAIQDWYKGLPTAFRLKALEGCFNVPDKEVCLFTTLHRSIEKVAEDRFSPESVFMHKLCGTNEIVEASHQINWAKSNLGQKVGLSEGPRFDINAGVINSKILKMPIQRMLEIYYKDMTLENYIPVLKSSFDKHIGDDGLYQSLESLHSSMKEKKPNLEELEDWVDVDDNWNPKGITPKGLVRVLSRAGLFEEME